MRGIPSNRNQRGFDVEQVRPLQQQQQQQLQKDDVSIVNSISPATTTSEKKNVSGNNDYGQSHQSPEHDQNQELCSGDAFILLRAVCSA